MNPQLTEEQLMKIAMQSTDILVEKGFIQSYSVNTNSDDGQVVWTEDGKRLHGYLLRLFGDTLPPDPVKIVLVISSLLHMD